MKVFTTLSNYYMKIMTELWWVANLIIFLFDKFHNCITYIFLYGSFVFLLQFGAYIVKC